MSDYKPYTKEQWAKISKMWNLYREDVGLEGDIVVKLVQQRKELGEINNAIENHRISTEPNLEAWHALRKESQ